MDMEEEEKVLVTLGRKAFNVSRMLSSDYLINEFACYLDFLPSFALPLATSYNTRTATLSMIQTATLSTIRISINNASPA